MKKRLLIIGAGFLQSFVIKKAKQMGYYVLTVDGNSDSIGFRFADEHKIIDITDERSCLKYALEKNIDGVMTAATDYGVLTAAFISNRMNLPGLDYDTAKLIKNKYLIRRQLLSCGIEKHIQCFEISTFNEIKKNNINVFLPCFIKPSDGSGSRGASKVEKMDELEKAINNAVACSRTKKAIVETFIEGSEYGVESFVFEGKVHVLGVMKKYMTKAPYYAELGHAIPCQLSSKTYHMVIKLAEEIIKALNIKFGSVNMDMLITKNGEAHLVDLGARMGGNMIGPAIIPYGTGFDYLSIAINAALGEKVSFANSLICGPVFSKILAFKGGVFESVPDFERLQEQFNVQIFHHITEKMIVNEYHTNLDGVGYIIARGKNIGLAKKNALSVYNLIKRHLKHGF